MINNNGVCQLSKTQVRVLSASFDYHNIGSNEWTSQNNCLELDLDI